MEIFEFIEKNIATIKDPVIFEIGSHIGIDSEKISRITGCKIYGFEPDPRNLEILRNKRSEFFHDISPLAVSDKEGRSYFHLSSGKPPEIYDDSDMNRDWSASNSLKTPKKHTEIHEWCRFDFYMEVETIKLDTYCTSKGIDRIDFLWMDVQGAEDLVIKGMENIKKNIRFIYTEYNDDELYEKSPTKNQILNMLGAEWEVILQFENDILIKNRFLES
jgi:FkbM family methyltransferase